MDNGGILSRLRSRIYRILATAFSPPKSEMENIYSDLLHTHSTLRPTETSLEEPSPEDSNLATLKKEYLRLFVGPGHVLCPPYEAVHRKDRPKFERGLVMGPSTADVQQAYLEAGLNLAETYTDLPDHIAAEMEFMHFLCAEETKLATQGNNQESTKMRRIQREFHKNHIEPWVGDFADCILHSTTSPFYRVTANVLKAFAKSDADYLTEAE